MSESLLRGALQRPRAAAARWLTVTDQFLERAQASNLIALRSRLLYARAWAELKRGNATDARAYLDESDATLRLNDSTRAHALISQLCGRPDARRGPGARGHRGGRAARTTCAAWASTPAELGSDPARPRTGRRGARSVRARPRGTATAAWPACSGSTGWRSSPPARAASRRPSASGARRCGREHGRVADSPRGRAPRARRGAPAGGRQRRGGGRAARRARARRAQGVRPGRRARPRAPGPADRSRPSG